MAPIPSLSLLCSNKTETRQAKHRAVENLEQLGFFSFMTSIFSPAQGCALHAATTLWQVSQVHLSLALRDKCISFVFLKSSCSYQLDQSTREHACSELHGTGSSKKYSGFIITQIMAALILQFQRLSCIKKKKRKKELLHEVQHDLPCDFT